MNQLNFPTSEIGRQRQRNAAFGASIAGHPLPPVESDPSALPDVWKLYGQSRPYIDARRAGLDRSSRRFDRSGMDAGA